MTWLLVAILFLPSGKVGHVQFFASEADCIAQVRIAQGAPYVTAENYRYRCVELHGRRPELVAKAIAEDLNPSN